MLLRSMILIIAQQWVMYNQIKHFLCHVSHVASTLYVVFAAPQLYQIAGCCNVA